MILLWHSLCAKFPQILHGNIFLPEEVSVFFSRHYNLSGTDKKEVKLLLNACDLWWSKSVLPHIPYNDIGEEISITYELRVIYYLLYFGYKDIARYRISNLFARRCLRKTLKNQKSLIVRLLFGEKITKYLKYLKQI